ncbi:rhodanese-like domain-containing protein [Cytophagaceae bacterium ABcell3]|nr:rhodanese-like domain-containing protein [Cytophagaceae bacterium ABcell3]
MMKRIFKISLMLLPMVLMSLVNTDPEPWKQEQLMKPEELAKLLSDGDKTNDPVIFNIGPAGEIKGSLEIGFVNDSKGIKKLETNLKNIPKDKAIVLYCGCCPFEHCPNIRPAFTLLNKKKYKNHRLLDLPKNLKVDWIDKGFPMED